MKFKTNKIYPSMPKQDKITEYARRISFYHLMMTEERTLSKVFDCTEMSRNAVDNGEAVGCLKRPDLTPCEECKRASMHYDQYRKNNRMRATALRQLNKELISENLNYEDLTDLHGKEYHPCNIDF